MADPRFFKRAGPFSLADIAKAGKAELHQGADPNFKIEDVATLDAAASSNLSFLDNRKYLQQFAESKAGACVVHPDLASRAPKGMHLLLSKNPYKSYALIAQHFYPKAESSAFRHPNAVVDPTAKIGDGCHIGPNAVIGANAELGARCRIEANAVIGEGVVLGADTTVMPGATLSHCILGARCIVYTGARIGQSGFGFAPDVPAPVKVPQLGRVVIGDDCEIGANTTIDRGALTDTEIGSGTMIDNLVQIGHGVRIGKSCVIVSQVGISGSTVIEDYVMLGGQVGLAGHINIGKGAKVAAQSGVMRDVAPGETIGGYPAVPIKQWHRQTALLNKQLSKPKKEAV